MVGSLNPVNPELRVKSRSLVALHKQCDGARWQGSLSHIDPKSTLKYDISFPNLLLCTMPSQNKISLVSQIIKGNPQTEVNISRKKSIFLPGPQKWPCSKPKKAPKYQSKVKPNSNISMLSPTVIGVGLHRLGLKSNFGQIRNWTSLELHEVIHHRLQSSPSRPN